MKYCACLNHSFVKMATVHKQKAEEQEENLWSVILKDVATSSARNRPEVTKTLLVLGDINSGKSTLMDRLCQISKTQPMGGKYTMSGCGLEYRFIDVQDEETDDLLDRMSIWILDGVVWHSHLLPFSLNKSSIEHTGVMIVVDMTQPWNIMESLERWAELLRKHIDSLNLPGTLVREMREILVKQFQSYVDPEEPPTPAVSSAGDEEGVALPLGETTLSSNLGIPIIVVCNKSDMVVELEKSHGYRDEHFDFIQQAIRKFCLKYGAALFYTSTKEDKNLQILHKYLLHRAYDLPFKEVAWVVDKDSLFIPSGWDNEKKIEILQEHMKGFSLQDEYESVIMPPKHSQPETSVSLMSAEDDQVFLMKLQAQMNKSPRIPSNMTTPPSTSRESKPSYSTLPQTNENDKADGETVLANFFNSLLTSKKPPMKSGMSSRATNRNEAAAEMDKLMGKKS